MVCSYQEIAKEVLTAVTAAWRLVLQGAFKVVGHNDLKILNHYLEAGAAVSISFL